MKQTKVLVVDDLAANRLALSRILDELDVQIVEADSGPAALSHLLKDEFALVLLDVQMPTMDGFETAELIRGTKKTKSIPIIFITANNNLSSELMRAYQLGAVDFLFKPLHAQILLAKVTVFLDLHQQRQTIEHTNRQLAAANRSKDQFLSVISHELRTPLNGVIGMSQLLNFTDLDGNQQAYNDIIKQSGEALLDLINDLLEMQKFSENKPVVDIREFDLWRILESPLQSISQRATEKGLDFVVRVEPEVPTSIKGDPETIWKVLRILIDNALKFTHTGEIRLNVKQLPEDTHLKLRFEVEDTGIGVPADKREDVFELFTQGDGSSTRRFGGTGLGLTIAQNLVQLLGGRIGLEELEGKATCFWFEVPVEETAEGSGYTCPSEVKPQLAGHRFLLLEDNSTRARWNIDLFARLGLKLEQVATEEEALQVCMESAQTQRPIQMLLANCDRHSGRLANLVTSLETMQSHQPHLVILNRTYQYEEATDYQQTGIFGRLLIPLQMKALTACLSNSVTSSQNAPVPQTQVMHPKDQEPKITPRILYVEDNYFNRLTMTMLVNSLGVYIQTVDNGEEAVHLLSNQRFELVLMDCKMPVMDGYEATRQIRNFKNKATKADVPIIAVTATVLEGEKERCFAAGMNAFLTKPVHSGLLFDLIEECLSVNNRVLFSKPQGPSVSPISS